MWRNTPCDGNITNSRSVLQLLSNVDKSVCTGRRWTRYSAVRHWSTQNIPRVYGTGRHTTEFTTARHRDTSRARLTHSISWNFVFFLRLFPNPRLGFPSSLCPLDFISNNVWISRLIPATCPAYVIVPHFTTTIINIWQKVQNSKIFIVRFVITVVI